MGRFVHRGFVHPGGVSPVKQDEEFYLQDPGQVGTPDVKTQVKKKTKEIEKEQALEYYKSGGTRGKLTADQKKARDLSQKVQQEHYAKQSNTWTGKDILKGVANVGSFFHPAGDIAYAGTEVAEGE